MVNTSSWQCDVPAPRAGRKLTDQCKDRLTLVLLEDELQDWANHDKLPILHRRVADHVKPQLLALGRQVAAVIDVEIPPICLPLVKRSPWLGQNFRSVSEERHQLAAFLRAHQKPIRRLVLHPLQCELEGHCRRQQEVPAVDQAQDRSGIGSESLQARLFRLENLSTNFNALGTCRRQGVTPQSDKWQKSIPRPLHLEDTSVPFR
mmetsp:Transcript_168850/g.542703  ORF Transcript_168850/g.542703 Transcript_168850/m.542703 type:complete len:205 (+) Transcript_168850:406-1020(+)